MKSTNYNFFNYVITKYEYDAGEEARRYDRSGPHTNYKQYDPNITKETYNPFFFNEIVLLAKGRLLTIDVSTLAEYNRLPGYCTLDSGYILGTFFDQYKEPSVTFIISPEQNLDQIPIMPNVSTLRWEAGSVIQPPLRFFLADGSFKKDSTVYSTSGAYSLISGNIEIISDCLGFIFNM